MTPAEIVAERRRLILKLHRPPHNISDDDLGYLFGLTRRYIRQQIVRMELLEKEAQKK